MSQQPPPPPTPPGWYPDPDDPVAQRYWTGIDWAPTQSPHPTASQIPPPSPSDMGHPFGPTAPYGKGLSAAPRTVQVAFWLQIGAVAILAILGFLFVILAVNDLGNPFLSQDDYDFALFILFASVFGLAQAVALGIFAKFLLDGANWARIASTVVLGLTVCSNVVALAFGVAVIVLLFVGESGSWFNRASTSDRG